MLTRAVGAVALTLSLSSGAVAGTHPSIVRRISCSVVRYYVAKYSVPAAETWARSHGATEAQIEAARRCLKDAPAETAEAARWSTQ
jgi:hypothetical protein